ncbi:hypothetical protein [Lentzea sp. NPDC092896]|uniref:hypothetical protein n=1 Tax=Lentzea sp. NPDC092896 TaxID=3364127 RepID=UPI00382A01E6
MNASNYTPMTHAQMVDLLTLIANSDHRKPSADMVTVWLMAAHTAKWRAHEAAEAVKQHITYSTEYMKPAHITALIHEARRADRTPMLALPGPAPASDQTRDDAKAAFEVVAAQLATTREARWKLRRLFAMPFSLKRPRVRNSPDDERRRAEAAAELARVRQNLEQS